MTALPQFDGERRFRAPFSRSVTPCGRLTITAMNRFSNRSWAAA